MSERPRTLTRILVDSTTLNDLFSGENVTSAQNILRDTVQNYEINISDVVRSETARFADDYTKDQEISSILRNLDNQLDPETTTASNRLMLQSSKNNLPHTHPDYFPRRNAGERAIIEKWQPGDTIVSDDSFFRNQQANDRFTMRIRPDMSPSLWAEMQASVMTTPQFLNMAAVDNTIALADHQAMAARFPEHDYLTPNEITHRQNLIAAGSNPHDVHRMSRSLDHTAARGVDGVSLAVNVAQGNVSGAALDAASMAADTQAVQQAALESAAKVIGREGLESGLKKIPVVGAVITAGTTLYATGAQAWHGNYDLAAAELAAGTAETIGNIPGFGLGDGARELARGGIIAAGGERFEAVEKSGLRQLGEAALDVGQQMTGHITGQITGQSLEQVLPAQYRNMTLGSDAMGERSEISRIALERMNGIAQASIKRGHMIVLQDGSVQPGSVGFGNNPQIAAGKNGGTLGVIYAGTGAMNDAQYNTVNNIHHWLTQQRQNEGLTAPVEVIAGSLATAQLLQLPTPQGFTPGQPLAAAPAQPASPQRRAPNNGLGGG